MPTLTFPISRIEGHAQVVVEVHDGHVASAHFQAMSFRGFEHFVQGVPAEQMTVIVPRICGVCSTAHHVAAVEALEDAFEVTPPPLASTIRSLLLLGQIIQNQATSLFFFTLPDLLGLEGMVGETEPHDLQLLRNEMAASALDLRRVGTDLITLAGGQFIHPVKAVVGGITSGIPDAEAAALRQRMVDALPRALALVDAYWELTEKMMAATPSLSTPYDGRYLTSLAENEPTYGARMLRVVDATGREVDRFAARDWASHLDFERSEYSYADRSTHQGHVIRANSLARANMIGHIGTPEADRVHRRFCETFGEPAHHVLLYDLARTIELVYGLERAAQVLSTPLDDEDADVPWTPRDGEGFGLVEAPRGPLIHHYTIEHGLIARAEFVIPTVHNVAAIEEVLLDVAKRHVSPERIDMALEREVGMVVRAFDPCIACATH